MLHKAIILIMACLGAVVGAQAQPAPPVHRIGVLLYAGAPPGLLEAFREGLRELGYVDGHNITIAVRNVEGKHEQLCALAAELVRLKVDVSWRSIPRQPTRPSRPRQRSPL